MPTIYRPLPTNPLSIRDVATMLGVGTQRVRQLDDVLQPIIVGRTRIYEPRRVARYHELRETMRRSTPTRKIKELMRFDFGGDS